MCSVTVNRNTYSNKSYENKREKKVLGQQEPVVPAGAFELGYD